MIRLYETYQLQDSVYVILDDGRKIGTYRNLYNTIYGQKGIVQNLVSSVDGEKIEQIMSAIQAQLGVLTRDPITAEPKYTDTGGSSIQIF